MPQLDFITFGIQIALMFFFSWTILRLFSKRVLPAYLHYNKTRYILWTQLDIFCTRYKFYTVLNLLHIICIFTKHVKILSLFLNTSNFSTGVFSRTFLKSFLKSFLKRSLRKNTFIIIYYYKSIFSKINLLSNFGQKNKLNFLILKNSTYFFVQNYLVNLFLKKKIYKKLLIKELKVCYMLNQIVFIKNLVNVKGTGKKLTIIFNLFESLVILKKE